MSAILTQTKQLYRRAIITEGVLLLSIFFISFTIEKVIAISIGLGMIVNFIPFCLFVRFIFSGRQLKNTEKMTALYKGEGFKFLVTILLLILSFKYYTNMHYVAFFVAYIFTLLLNNMLPIYFTYKAR